MVDGKKERNLQDIYHLTDLENLESILKSGGLICRDNLYEFSDIANIGIINFREKMGLNKYVPFHFFPHNPFDGDVQTTYPNKDFIYICVSRSLAQQENFFIIPRHPKSLYPLWDNVYDYDEGIEKINWELLELRDYHDRDSRNACLAECICKDIVYTYEFSKIVVKNSRVYDDVTSLIMNHGNDKFLADILIKPSWFVR